MELITESVVSTPKHPNADLTLVIANSAYESPLPGNVSSVSVNVALHLKMGWPPP